MNDSTELDRRIEELLRVQLVPGTDEELAEAADAFGLALDLVAESDPRRGALTARLGVVRAMRAQRVLEGLDLLASETGTDWEALAGQVTTALAALDTGWREAPEDDPYRTVVRCWRAVMRVVRFAYFGGGDDDRDRARADLEAILELPQCDGAVADVCHLYLAYLYLLGSMPAEVRGRRPSPQAYARLIAAGNLADAETARIARTHLDSIAGSGSVPAAMVDSLRALLLLAAGDRDMSDEGIGRIVADLGNAVETDPEYGDMGPVRDLLEIMRIARRNRPEDQAALAGALTRMAGEFGDGNPFQRLLRGMAGQLLDRGASPEERDAALELLENVLRELPYDHPDRAATLGRLVRVLTGDMAHTHSAERLERVRRILLEAIGRSAADAENEALNHFLLLIVDRLRGMSGHGPQELKEAIDRLKKVAGLLPAEHPLQRLIPAFLASLLLHRYLQGAGLENLDAARHYAELTSGTAPEDAPQRDIDLIMEWLRIAAPLARATSFPDLRLIEETGRKLRELAARLPEGHPFRAQIVSSAHELDAVLPHPSRPGAGPPTGRDRVADAVQAGVAAAREMGAGHPLFPSELAGAGATRAYDAYRRRDLGLLDEGLALLSEARQAADEAWPLRSWLLGVFGWTFMLRYELSHDRADLNNAIDLLEESVRAGDDDAIGVTTVLSLNSLSTAYHRRGDDRLGDRRRAAETGLASLRARAWSVMLERDTERAFTAALAAAGEGAEVALQCVADGLPGLAVEALERGRAMVLHTATTDANLPTLLRESGHDDLAADWEAALRETGPVPWDRAHESLVPPGPPGPRSPVAELRLPSDLRERVMDAIAGTELERMLFTPADPAEIAAALRAAGAAALVYLIPYGDGRGGLALVVDAAGQPRPIRLPRLRTGPRSRVEAFAEAQRDRQRSEADGRVRRRWRHALGDLCDWAWTAVMEPVLGAVADSPGSRTRVVLVPVGELGAVPWHAARRTVGDGAYRYACQDAVISYAASARQFVDARRHGHRPWPSAAALVRVAGTSPLLYWASKEIEQIHQRHYRDGDLVGGRRRPGEPRPSPATAANVRRLLPGPRSGGASLLHLGCHAYSAPRPVDSHLLLTRGETLSMTDILRRARERPYGVPGGLVVLAACGSDLTSRDHDEALTLSTAFLGAGAVGVVGARWPVDDRPTALFMTLFHHYLNAGYDDPAVALRATQIWMLNPRRTVPASLSGELAGLLDDTRLGEPESWAAFTYQGR